MKLFERTVKWPICNAVIINATIDKDVTRGRSRASAISKMVSFVIIVNGFRLLTIIRKSSILDVAAALDLSLLTCEACRLYSTECTSISLTNTEVKDSNKSEKFDLVVNYTVLQNVFYTAKNKIEFGKHILRSRIEPTYLVIS